MSAKTNSNREFSLLHTTEYGDEVLSFLVLPQDDVVCIARFWVDANGMRSVKEAVLDFTAARRIYRYFARHGFVPVV